MRQISSILWLEYYHRNGGRVLWEGLSPERAERDDGALYLRVIAECDLGVGATLAAHCRGDPGRIDGIDERCRPGKREGEGRGPRGRQATGRREREAEAAR